MKNRDATKKQTSPPAGSASVRLSGLCKDVPGSGRRAKPMRILQGVDLEVPHGRMTAVVGPSGSGKSTLLLCAAGLEPATQGRVEVLGEDIAKLSPRKRAHMRSSTLGFIFQEYNLVSSLTVWENVALPARLAGRRPPKKDIDAALERLGIAHRASRRPDQLSGGEKQRVAVARVVANRPRIVFADEPTGALDLSSGAAVLDWLQAMPAQGTDVLMVTHDPHAAARADRVVVMRSGEVHKVIPGGDANAVSRCILAAQGENIGESEAWA